ETMRVFRTAVRNVESEKTVVQWRVVQTSGRSKKPNSVMKPARNRKPVGRTVTRPRTTSTRVKAGHFQPRNGTAPVFICPDTVVYRLRVTICCRTRKGISAPRTRTPRTVAWAYSGGEALMNPNILVL